MVLSLSFTSRGHAVSSMYGSDSALRKPRELLEQNISTQSLLLWSKKKRIRTRLRRTRRHHTGTTSTSTQHSCYRYHFPAMSILFLWGAVRDSESFSTQIRRVIQDRRIRYSQTFRDYRQGPLRQSLFGPVDDDDSENKMDEGHMKQHDSNNDSSEEEVRIINGMKKVFDELQESLAANPSVGNGSLFQLDSLNNKSKAWLDDQNDTLEKISISNITNTVQEVLTSVENNNATLSDTVQAVLGNINSNGDTVQAVLGSLKHLNSSDDGDGEEDDDDDDDDGKDISFSCRIVAASDGKIPTRRSLLPPALYESPNILSKLDAIYHATSYEQTRYLEFMEKDLASSSVQSQQRRSLGADEEAKALQVLRQSLEDSGFNLMSRRDLDLCQALNNEYLFRLSIREDLSELDESIAKDFFPEKFELFENGTIVPTQPETEGSPQELLYDGRVLIFWRGYGQELTRGRLILPKIDYLQASIVQKAASGVRTRLNIVEDGLAEQSKLGYERISTWTVSLVANALQKIPSGRVSKWAGEKLIEVAERTQTRMEEEEQKKQKDRKRIRLRRYGGTTGALTPFMICEVGYKEGDDEILNGTNGKSADEMPLMLNSEAVDHDIYKAMNRGQISCRYDEEKANEMGIREGSLPMQLLDRVSISNLLDFTPDGTKNLIKSIFGKNELNEPTYQEVVVVWRPLPPKPKFKSVLTPPKFVYDFADMFDIDGLPDSSPPDDEIENAQPPLEIRAFQSVPMANLPAVLPKTKLVFGAADALKFDLISITSLILVIGSQRFDNPRLDLLALGSFCFWLFRTVIRYSNKLARYDLLVKKFLTSKITARNAGALKYVSTEAGTYRATRASLVYTWLASPERAGTSDSSNERHQIIKDGILGVNSLIGEDKQVRVDIDAALRDLENLELLVFSENGQQLETIVRDKSRVAAALNKRWLNLFDGGAKDFVDYAAPKP